MDPYRQPQPPLPPRFIHADSGHLNADAVVSGVIAVVPLALTLDALSLTGLPRLDLPARFAVTFAGNTEVGLGAGLLGWLACAVLGAAIALAYVYSLARVGSGAGPLTGMLHGMIVWAGGVAWAFLWTGDSYAIDPPAALSLGIGLAAFGAAMGALLRRFILRSAENFARAME